MFTQGFVSPSDVNGDDWIRERILLDTGCSMIAVSTNFVKLLQRTLPDLVIRKSEYGSPTAQGAWGGPTDSPGMVYLTIRLANQEHLHEKEPKGPAIHEIRVAAWCY